MSQLTEEEDLTKNSYNKHANLWAKAHSNERFWSEEMHKFRELLPSGRILEIGSGSGRDAKELLELGYEYVGTDISERLLKQASKNNPGAHFEEASVYDLNFDKAFDGFWCSAVLVHIPKKRINEALQAIRRNMRLGAIGFISLKEGSGEKIESDTDEDGGQRFFSYWQNKEFKDVLTENGFEVLHEKTKPISERTKWLTYLVKTI
jgi:SAM-dependent methyltransferase